MFQGIKRKKGDVATVQSYLGMMTHGNAHKVRQKVEKWAKASGGGVTFLGECIISSIQAFTALFYAAYWGNRATLSLKSGM
jgi:uncharacterized protein (DUF2147 family)